MTSDLDGEKARVAAWFRALRDAIVAAFEALEFQQAEGPTARLAAARLKRLASMVRPRLACLANVRNRRWPRARASST